MRILLITLSVLLTNIGIIMAQNLHNFSIQDIDGNQINLDKFKGKPVLLVNTAMPFQVKSSIKLCVTMLTMIFFQHVFMFSCMHS